MDPIKNNELMHTFAPKNLRKVNADIFFKKHNGDFLFYHLAFEGHEIVAVHLLKKDEWFYGIYLGCRKTGFIYPGDVLTTAQQIRAFTNYFPDDKNNLAEKVKVYAGELEYHHCQNDAYCIIGEHHQKKIITKTKIQKI